MRMLLQHGVGADDVCRRAVAAQRGCGVILAARAFASEAALVACANALTDLGGCIGIDPQAYAQPMTDARAFADAVEPLLELNRGVRAAAVILPGPALHQIGEAERTALTDVASAARGVASARYLTVCLARGFFASERQYNRLFACLERLDLEGFYLLPERPDDDYLTDDPVWMKRLLELCADLALTGRRVVVGYAGHQLLPLACAAVDGLAVGADDATRGFGLKMAQGESATVRKPTYYCPQTLSEYSLPYLDLARGEGVLRLMAPDRCEPAPRVAAMLAAKDPTAAAYDWCDGCLHYWRMLSAQCAAASAGRTFDARVAWQRRVLDEAEAQLRFLRKHGVCGLQRDFLNYVGVSRSAIQAFAGSRGVNLSLSDGLFGASEEETP